MRSTELRIRSVSMDEQATSLLRQDGDQVILTVTAHNPTILPPEFGRTIGTDTVARTVRVRIEKAR